MANAAVPVQPGQHTTAEEYPDNIEHAAFRAWDNKLFAQELVRRQIAPKAFHVADDSTPTVVKTPTGQIDQGTWEGSQMALTEFYSRVEQGYSSFFEASGFETSIPLDIQNRNDLYQWDTNTKYPPHLALVPDDRKVAQNELFSKLGLFQASVMIKQIVPKNFIERVEENLLERFRVLLFGTNYEGDNFTTLERKNEDLFRRRTATDIMQGKNIGDHKDWWSDARFAQQFFTGTNPTTIKRAGEEWIGQFREAAHAQGEDAKHAAEFLATVQASSLYVQDYSYYRDAVKAPKDAKMFAGTGSETKYCSAPVVLFHLPESGQLHPIAIVIDYVVDIQKSVTLFNKRLTPIAPDDDKGAELLEEGKTDWPWRYAKQVVQVADWSLHEIIVHLTWTHLVEEATIVAANRAFQVDHPVFRLLEPHWYRTLPINAGARAVLVPDIIFDLIGLSGEQPYEFIKYHYKEFHWTERYVPSDLEKRGFPLAELDHPRFRNYAYARNILPMWSCIRKFVGEMLEDFYPTDQEVKDDKQLAKWCEECQTHGQITGFPSIQTKKDLFDACTMAIHIAAPQHTAVNYLQNYYQAFIPNKPPALYQPVPTSLSDLRNYTEHEVIMSLPVHHQRDWLLAAHIPWLLSYKSAKETSLLEYSISLYNLVRRSQEARDKTTKGIASRFYSDLLVLGKIFKRHSDEMTKGTIEYTVMDPAATAVSILI